MHDGASQGVQRKESACKCRRHRRCRLYPWVDTIPWRRAWQPTSVFLPRDRGAWWATVHGVTENQTQLSDWAWACTLKTQIIQKSTKRKNNHSRSYNLKSFGKHPSRHRHKKYTHVQFYKKWIYIVSETFLKIQCKIICSVSLKKTLHPKL